MPGLTRAAISAPAGGGLAGASPAPVRALGAARGYDFWFTRLKYESGDWDVDQRMPSNLLTSLIDYTNLRVDPKERIVALADPAMLSAPFCYMTGHKLVEFNAAERRNFERYVRNGGFVLVDDCNHDIDGLFAKSFERADGGDLRPEALKQLPPNHPVFRSFFKFDGPPNTGVRTQRLGRRPRPRLSEGDRRSMAASACSTATRIMAASGITTGTTSASSPRTIPSSASTS